MTNRCVRFALPGSPVAALQARIATELAGGRISCSCPHPATASRLELPDMILACEDCHTRICGSILLPGPCTCCGAATSEGACWGAGSVLVIARCCSACGGAGNAAITWN
jgi:hypothetical protein